MIEVTQVRTGWAPRAIVAVAMAALAVLCVTAFLYEDRAAAGGAEGLWGFVGSTLVGHALGGAAAGFALAGLFGRPVAVGWALSVVGGLLVALLGGLLGGLFNTIPALLSGASGLEDAIRIGSALLVTPLAIASAPWLGGVWLVAIAGVHLVVRRSRVARRV
ncbi:MAG: hypothetical protein AAGB05_06375 [Pseudomonadota bacterium]